MPNLSLALGLTEYSRYTLDSTRPMSSTMRNNWQNWLEVVLLVLGLFQFITASFSTSVGWPDQVTRPVAL